MRLITYASSFGVSSRTVSKTKLQIYKFSRVVSALLKLSLGSEERRKEKKEGEKGRGGRESRLDRADASGTSVFA